MYTFDMLASFIGYQVIILHFYWCINVSHLRGHFKIKASPTKYTKSIINTMYIALRIKSRKKENISYSIQFNTFNSISTFKFLSSGNRFAANSSKSLSSVGNFVLHPLRIPFINSLCSFNVNCFIN